MNAKTAKKIRKLARTAFPNVEAETSYTTKRHKPRWSTRQVMKEVDHPTDGTKITRLVTEPFRINTNQSIVSNQCQRGVIRLLKKSFKQGVTWQAKAA